MNKKEILDILDNAKDEKGSVPMRLVRQAFDKLPTIQPVATDTNVGDKISRQAAIDAVNTALFPKINTAKDAEKALRELPPAQPEQQHGRIFQEIFVEYPSYNTYPEYKGKPYFSIKYTENGQEFIVYGTYKPEVLSEYLKEYFMPSAQPEPQWIPCSERLPEESGYYIITAHDGVGHRTTFVKYQKKAKSWDFTGARSYWRVIAWMPLPEPYQEGEQDG